MPLAVSIPRIRCLTYAFPLAKVDARKRRQIGFHLHQFGQSMLITSWSCGWGLAQRSTRIEDEVPISSLTKLSTVFCHIRLWVSNEGK